MNTVELFCGTKSVSKELGRQGHRTFTVDNDPKTSPDLCKDILDVTFDDFPYQPDFLWASPPCTEYSKAKSRGERNIDQANLYVLKTLQLIQELKPKVWIIENPQTGKLKDQAFMWVIPFSDASYCQYGYTYRKQTRFWSNVALKLKTCKKDCPSIIITPKGKKHSGSAGNGRKEWTTKHYSKKQKYSIPPELCQEILNQVEDFLKTV